MPGDEGDALHQAALATLVSAPGTPWVEVGSYCGRSTIWLGDAARQANTILFAIDHHRGSEENQQGWEHHDVDVVDSSIDEMDTLPTFRAAIHGADLEQHVVAMVGHSRSIARFWSTPVGFLFIDGGHGVQPARDDYEGWTPHVALGGSLAIHDVFPDPADGGRPPFEEIYLKALESGRFELTSVTGSLRVLTRIA